MSEKKKKEVWVRVKDEAGNEFICPIDMVRHDLTVWAQGEAKPEQSQQRQRTPTTKPEREPGQDNGDSTQKHLRHQGGVFIVSLLDTPDQSVFVNEQRQALPFIDLFFDLFKGHTLSQSFHIFGSDEGVAFERGGGLIQEFLFQQKKLEFIADFHQADKFHFGHDLAEGAPP